MRDISIRSIEQKQAIVDGGVRVGCSAAGRGTSGRHDAEFDLPLVSGSSGLRRMASRKCLWHGLRWYPRTGDAGDREIEFAGKLRIRIPASLSPVLAAAVFEALGDDDPGSERGSGVAGDRPDRHAQRYERAGAASAAGVGPTPHAGDLDGFRGARGDLFKIVWHDGIGMSLHAKRTPRITGCRGGWVRVGAPMADLRADCRRGEEHHVAIFGASRLCGRGLPVEPGQPSEVVRKVRKANFGAGTD